MTTVTVGKDNLTLILTYDLSNSISDRLIFTGANVTSPNCEFEVTNLTITTTPLEWLEQTTYRLTAKHINSTLPTNTEEFMLVVLRDAAGDIVSAMSSFNRSNFTWSALDPFASIRCCPRPTIVYSETQ